MSLATKAQLRSASGAWRTTSLFTETARKGDTPLWSLAQWRDIYVAAGDYTEYRAAVALVGEWSIWCELRKSETLAAIFDGWREEVRVAVTSQVHTALLKAVETGAAGSSAAAKELLTQLNGGAGGATKRAVGRPRKDKSSPPPDPKQTASDARRLKDLLPK